MSFCRGCTLPGWRERALPRNEGEDSNELLSTRVLYSVMPSTFAERLSQEE